MNAARAVLTPVPGAVEAFAALVDAEVLDLREPAARGVLGKLPAAVQSGGGLLADATNERAASPGSAAARAARRGQDLGDAFGMSRRKNACRAKQEEQDGSKARTQRDATASGHARFLAARRARS